MGFVVVDEDVGVVGDVVCVVECDFVVGGFE